MTEVNTAIMQGATPEEENTLAEPVEEKRTKDEELGDYLESIREEGDSDYMEPVSTTSPGYEVPEEARVGLSEESKGLLNYNPATPIMELNKAEVKEGIKRGNISPEQRDEWITRKQLAENGLMGMTPKYAKLAWKKGLIDNKHAQAYLDKQNGTAFGYAFRETKNTVIGGLLSGVENAIVGLAELGQLHPANLGQQMHSMRGKQFTPSEAMETIKDGFKQALPGTADFIEGQTTVYSKPAKVAKPFVQFAIPYSKVTKATRASGIAAKFVNTTVGKAINTKLGPKAAQWFGRIGEETVLGGITDYFVFDPYEDGLADMLSEQFDMQNPVVDFLKTNPDNPAPFERLKQVVEGAALGVAFDSVLSGLKYTKGKLWASKGADKELVAEEVDKLADHLGMETKPFEPDEPIKDIQKNYSNGKVHVKYKRIGDKQFRNKAFKSDEEMDAWYKENAEGVPAEKPIEPEKSDEVRGSQTDAKGEKSASTPRKKEDPNKGKSSETPADEADADVPKKKVPPKAIRASNEDLKKSSIRLFNEEDIAESSEEWISKIETSDEAGETMIRQIATLRADDITEARGNGPVTHAETDEMAEQFMGKLLGRSTDKAMGAARKLFGDVEGIHFRIRAMNKFFVKYTNSIQDLIKDPGDMTFRDELRVIEHISKLQELQGIVFGVRTEMGRGLSQYNLPWQEYQGAFDAINRLPQDAMDDMIGHQDQIQKAIQAFKSAKDAPAKLKSARAIGNNPKLMGVLEFVQANLLWNPATHIRNIIGGSAAILNNSMKRYAGLRWHKTFGGGKAETMKEWAAYRYGMSVGIKSALALPGVTKKSFKNPGEVFGGLKGAWHDEEGTGRVWKALFTGKPQLDALAKVEGQNTNAVLDSLNFNVAGARIPLGTLLKLPFHGLTAGDEFLKSIGYFSELHAQVAREGIDLGKTGKDLDDFMNHFGGKPTKEQHYKALENAREVTFTEQLGPTAEGVNKALNTQVGIVAKITAVPFYKVIVNLVRYAGRNSPLGLLGGKTQEAIKRGGRDRYEAIAGVAMGTGMMLTAGTMYEEGKLTGRVPAHMRETYNAKGITAYSIKVGNRWLSYEGIDPLAQLLGTAADIGMAKDYYDVWMSKEDQQDADEAFEELTVAIISAISEPILNKTMAESMQNLASTILEPERNPLDTEVRNQLQKFIPGSTGLGHIQTLLDDTVRETNTMLDVLWSKIDSNNRFPKRDPIFGTIQKRDKAWPAPALGLFKAREEVDNPVLNEMMRIGANKTAPSDKITKKGIEVKMTPEEYDQFGQIISTVPLQEELENLINSPEYQQNGNFDDLADVISGTIQDARDFARKELLDNNKRISDKMLKKFYKRVEARKGSLMQPTSYGEIQTLVPKK